MDFLASILNTSYNKDTLRVLLVNTKKYYVYWELSDETLEKQGLDLNKDKLYFKVNDKQGNELFEFDSSFALGEYFIKLQFENASSNLEVAVENFNTATLSQEQAKENYKIIKNRFKKS